VVLMETVELFRMTSDEAPLRRGGGMQYASQALLRRRLFFPVLALGGLLLVAGCATDGARMHYDAGNTLLKQWKLMEAEKEFREAVRKKPNFAEAHFALGSTIYEQKERLPLVEREYREAIRLKPYYPVAVDHLASLLWSQKKYDEAIQVWREAVWAKPDWLYAIESLAASLDETPLKKRKEARQYWEKALKLEKNPVVIEHIKKRLAEQD